MDRNELVHALADEVTRLIKKGDFKQDEYGRAIGFVCSKVKSLKRDVGRVLNKRGQIKRAIAKIKQEELF